ncbi:serpin family protein [Actinomyces sp. MRS3W]|uniref:serpin family protein n=1 Tax=Actinomyces sp. MRS3W TaxID=2800796 RepID=UPI0028FD59C7|nr:serpin family protein [Actinomyces sp. MRS3W]MDU0349654.1 serpin family protein [Actinomyces sp. MRS3W]
MASNDASPAPLEYDGKPMRRPLVNVSRRHLLTLPPVVAAMATLAACGSSTNQSPSTASATPSMTGADGATQAIAFHTDVEHQQVALEDAPALGSAVAACHTLSEAMLRRQLRDQPGGNALACPVGLSLAIALLYAGSDAPGQGVDALLGTQEADASATAAPSTDGTMRDLTWSALQNSLLAYNPDEATLAAFDPDQIPNDPLLHIANRVLLVGDDPEVEQSYLDAAQQWYAATTEHAAREDAKAVLDAWAKLHTGGLIKESGVEIQPQTRLVLQNALLFAAQWADIFMAEDTYEQDFTLLDGSTIQARLMHGEFFLTYAQGDRWQAVRMPYLEASGTGSSDAGDDGDYHDRFVMDVILPDAGVALDELPEGTWAQATAELTTSQAENAENSKRVELALPTFDLESGTVDLLPLFPDLNVTLDSLDHIDTGLNVDQVVQQVRLMVKEEGTVAAALTEIGVGDSAPLEEDKPLEFIVDHPFSLRIVDTFTGLVLVEGVIVDPTPA